MDDLDVFVRDFGYRPQGKSAPMRSDAGDRRASTVRSSTSSSSPSPLFNDVFGGPPKFTNPSNNNFKNEFDYDSIFKNNDTSNDDSNNNNNNRNDNSKNSSSPVYDKPVYDDDMFEGLPGLKSKSVSSSTTNLRFDENVFASMGSSPKQNRRINDHFDDLLGNLGRNEKVPEPKSSERSSSPRVFDDLLGGFGSSSPASGSRRAPESHKPPNPTSVIDDPFVVLESNSTPVSSSSPVFTDPLEEIGNLGKSGSSKANAPSVSVGDFGDLDPLNGLGKSVPSFVPEKGGREKVRSPSRMGPSHNRTKTSSVREHNERTFRYSESPSQKEVPVDDLQGSPHFDMPSVSTDSKKSFSENASSPQYPSVSTKKNFQSDVSPESVQVKSDDIWLSVSEVPLYTQPTKAPPPSRPPPPIPRRTSKAGSSFSSGNVRKNGNGYSPSYSSYSGSPKPGRPVGENLPASQIDELEDFFMAKTQNSVPDNANVHPSEEMDAAAAAMKEAMDRAEAKFRHAKEVREREYVKAARSKESVQMEKEDHVKREKEEEEREQRRLERERERARQAEIERERARQAVDRATREARERAAAEARLRAERASVEKVQAEARERAERAAVQRAQAEARERAAAEARERAEKAAAEARERENGEARVKEANEKAEARRRAERAAVDKAAAEARERAAAEARERAAAASRMNQQKNEDDIESFFSSRSNSAPKARASSPDSVFDSQFQNNSQFQNKVVPESAKRASSTSVPSSNMSKASSTTNIVDDLSSIFGAPTSSGEFQDVEGESEGRRRARLERHQRTQERAAKALAEKNQRDLQAQREQEERYRIGGTLDFEIKRWAAGKEGNLRALLSTLQYVLWPECGWQPVSLTDLITGASVKKCYRKATLCIHPDKVQQKGATLQQKYIAEKVFDLLKEAWNKFNSEELF